MSWFASRAVRCARKWLVLVLVVPATLSAQDSLANAEFAGRRARLLATIPDSASR